MFTSTKYSISIPYMHAYEEDIFSTLHTILQKTESFQMPLKSGRITGN